MIKQSDKKEKLKDKTYSIRIRMTQERIGSYNKAKAIFAEKTMAKTVDAMAVIVANLKLHSYDLSQSQLAKIVPNKYLAKFLMREDEINKEGSQ